LKSLIIYFKTENPKRQGDLLIRKVAYGTYTCDHYIDLFNLLERVSPRSTLHLTADTSFCKRNGRKKIQKHGLWVLAFFSLLRKASSGEERN